MIKYFNNENEFRKFLKVPPLGLTRFYQEKAAHFLDQSNLFQGAVAEFVYVVFSPIERSFKMMQQELQEMTRDGNLPENSKEYYRMWLKILEENYMNVLTSRDFTQILSNTLDAIEGYTLAGQNLLRDVLQMLQVPTNREMDEVYKELHKLKKRVKQIEKAERKSAKTRAKN